MDKVLALSTPHQIDVAPSTEIADAQKLLANNRFDDFAPYGDASQSGEFGETTAAACHRAKFWLGWPAGESSGTFGNNLETFLKTGKIPRTYWLRRQMRLRRAKQGKKLRALALAVSQIGKKESPAGSNRVLYSLWYGMIGPWCLMFQTWVAVSIGIPWALKGRRFAYVPYLDAAAAAHLYGLSFVPSGAVGPSDLVTFDWTHDGTSDHVGMFERWINRGAGTFFSIEGNTAVGDDSNGGAVMRRERSLSMVHHMIRVDV